MSNGVIRRALEQRLSEWAVNQRIMVAWEGVRFTPTPGRDYCRAWLMPAPAVAPGIDLLRKNSVGYLQVAVMCADSGVGVGMIDNLVASLCAGYSIGTKIQIDAGYLCITKIPEVGRVYIDENYLRVDVFIYYFFTEKG